MFFKLKFVEGLKCRKGKFYLGCSLGKVSEKVFGVVVSLEHFKPQLSAGRLAFAITG